MNLNRWDVVFVAADEKDTVGHPAVVLSPPNAEGMECRGGILDLIAAPRNSCDRSLWQFSAHFVPSAFKLPWYFGPSMAEHAKARSFWIGIAAIPPVPLDSLCGDLHPYYMPIATLRLTAAEKRKFTAEERRRGLTLSEYLRQAGEAEANRTDWKSFFAAMPAVELPRHVPTDLSTREGLSG